MALVADHLARGSRRWPVIAAVVGSIVLAVVALWSHSSVALGRHRVGAAAPADHGQADALGGEIEGVSRDHAIARDLRHSESVSIAGIVEDERGSTVGGAHVAATDPEGGPVLAEGVSANDGRFTVVLPSAPEHNMVRFIATAARHEAGESIVDVTKCPEPLVVRTPRALRRLVVSGQVRDAASGAVLPNALVLGVSDAGQLGPPFLEVVATDVDGMFRLPLETFDELEIHAYAFGYYAEELVASAGIQEVRLTREKEIAHHVAFMPRGGADAGEALVVRLIAGPAKDNAQHAPRDSAERARWKRTREVVKKLRRIGGKFSLRARYATGVRAILGPEIAAAVMDLAPGSYSFLVVTSKGRAAASQVEVTEDSPAWIFVPIELADAQAVDGRLWTTSALDGAKVSVVECPWLSAPVNPNGTFRLDGLPAGRWTVIVSRRGCMDEQHEIVVRETGLVEVTVKNEAMLTVRVTDESGAAVPGATVCHVGLQLAVTDERGLAEIGGLPHDQPVTIRICRASGSRDQKEVQVRARLGTREEVNVVVGQ